jgi:hypothetical protein
MVALLAVMMVNAIFKQTASLDRDLRTVRED